MAIAELTERMARAMVERLCPAQSKDDLRQVDVDETDVDFIELAQLALNEILRNSEGCGVCGCAVYKDLPTARSSLYE